MAASSPISLNGVVPRQIIQYGLNFAVAGATALDRTFFQDKGFVVDGAAANYSLMVQLDWFKDVLTDFCTSPSSCKEFLGSSLFIVGEIGGNDYGYPLSETTDFQVLRSYVTPVVSLVSSVIIELIDLGARTLMVPGSLPLGCNPAYLTRFEVMEKDEYDQSGCLKWLNNFFSYHNQLLQIELRRLQVLYPHVNIIYADYFHDALRMYRSPKQFGFGTDFNKVCCGGGGPYNFNDTALCGDEEVIACDDPSEYIYWDGYHFTEAAYRWMAKGLVYGPYTSPKLSLHCITIERPLEI
ncbi:hypothetical protein PIB30_040257 [Stylosanthes scabra]|uniref:Sinapine esterase n=1 Tax=Stylosanthes scabra TaxID=79078 RepID=A0ABU6WCP6_9FABA|nr:hypothetical protein [Stylosanthes scabra]